MKPLTRLVVDYVESEGIAVHDYVALEIPDNLQVAAQDPARMIDIYTRVERTNIEALLLSARVARRSRPCSGGGPDEAGTPADRTSVVWRKRVAEGVEPGGRRRRKK